MDRSRHLSPISIDNEVQMLAFVAKQLTEVAWEMVFDKELMLHTRTVSAAIRVVLRYLEREDSLEVDVLWHDMLGTMSTVDTETFPRLLADMREYAMEVSTLPHFKADRGQVIHTRLVHSNGPEATRLQVVQARLSEHSYLRGVLSSPAEQDVSEFIEGLSKGETRGFMTTAKLVGDESGSLSIDRRVLVSQYCRTMVAAMAFSPLLDDTSRPTKELSNSNALFLGVGGGELISYCDYHFRGMTIDAVDFDGDMVDIARSFFELAPTRRMVIDDAWRFLSHCCYQGQVREVYVLLTF